MMKIDTLRFGEIMVEEKDIIQFQQGLPGFEELKQFTLVKLEGSLPFSFLQSLDDGAVAFLVTNPFVFFPQYEFSLSDSAQEELHIQQEQDVAVWGIVTVQGSLEKATVNLLAPIVINRNKTMGKQVILHGSDYKTKHRIFPEGEPIQSATKGESAC
jgi:flagellar assembly factor FliW